MSDIILQKITRQKRNVVKKVHTQDYSELSEVQSNHHSSDHKR